MDGESDGEAAGRQRKDAGAQRCSAHKLEGCYPKEWKEAPACAAAEKTSARAAPNEYLI